VVDEVLLELVEDQIEVLLAVGCGRTQCRNGVACPRIENVNYGVGLAAQAMRDACAKDGALPNATGPVQHRQPRCLQVRGDRLRLPCAAEEEQRIEVRIAERREPLVR
jgi:hypothetical protein